MKGIDTDKKPNSGVRRSAYQRLMTLSVVRSLYSRDEEDQATFDRYCARLRRRAVRGR